MIYIYAYQNKINGKIYIGQTIDLFYRDKKHKTNKKINMHIDNAIKKYGRNNFDYWVIKIVDTQSEGNQEEIFWISEMRNHLGAAMIYNKADGGKHNVFSTAGRKHSAKTKKKMSESHKGKVLSQENKINISISMIGKNKNKPSPNKGKKSSAETKQKSSKSHLGQIPWNKGKPRSEETKRKISESLKKKHFI